MLCSKCGRENTSDSSFCRHCGTPLLELPSYTAVPEMPQAAVAEDAPQQGKVPVEKGDKPESEILQRVKDVGRDIMGKTKELLETGYDRSKRMVRQTQIQMRLGEIERDLKDNYRILGEGVYGLYKNQNVQDQLLLEVLSESFSKLNDLWKEKEVNLNTLSELSTPKGEKEEG